MSFENYVLGVVTMVASLMAGAGLSFGVLVWRSRRH
jgi:hypothetical protein